MKTFSFVTEIPKEKHLEALKNKEKNDNIDSNRINLNNKIDINLLDNIMVKWGALINNGRASVCKV